MQTKMIVFLIVLATDAVALVACHAKKRDSIRSEQWCRKVNVKT